MQIILDFDHTVFRMSAMHVAMTDAMKAIGIAPDVYKEAYNVETHWKVFTVEGVSKRLEAMTKIPQAKIRDALRSALNQSSRFLYDDVADACAELHKAGHKLYLLSWGDEDWQREKIEQSGIAGCVDQVITVGQLKANVLAELREGDSELVLVDDKPAELRAVQQMDKQIVLIRMRRDDGKYSDQATPSGMDEVADMNELLHKVEERQLK